MVVSVTLDFVRDVCYDECRVSMREDDALEINVISRRGGFAEMRALFYRGFE